MIFRRRTPEPDRPSAELAPIRPETPFFAVGDLHGCDHLFDRLLRHLDRLRHPDAVLVTVGDYVDRGEDTARLLRRVRFLSEAAGDAMQCIMGNHETMLLDTLDNPAKHGPRWLRHGGLQTLASYRVPPVLGERPEKDWLDMRDRLVDAMGEETIAWLRNLPLSWQTGNVVVTHAGADPAAPIETQSANNLLWGHPDFLRLPRSDGLWVVHGHTITQTPEAAEGRITTDTGAYATGVLTAALVETDSVTFHSA
ncbi:metallophosphoesterase [Maliponia aquimaris]|uniref:Bis(5'-nucleosyl)-tetraphosphatase [symmetrical] n=1 Tax=Maliponia aquimaris TaxID=1673631 RepID=A0A238KA49_9RHOB|nr:metallophosphoesterase [Maliponia aquimaris]SMX38846.1 Bis(5'-nucleosyl)-tetraphosphatase [symmetrical] [Maliponia aquimaris]